MKFIVGVAGIISALTVAGCVTQIDEPAISPAGIASAAQRGISANDLATGRRIFLTQCTECHSPDKVTKYSREEWREIVEEMAPRAHLNETQKKVLWDYLQTARGET